MLAPDDVVLLTLALLLLGWAAYDSASLRGEPDERALWVAMTAVGLYQAIKARPVYFLIERLDGPGWAMVISHGLSIVVGAAALDLLHQLTAAGMRVRAASMAAAAAVVAASIAPWVLAPPAAVPAALRGVTDFYDSSWASAVHWGVVLGYLGAVVLASTISSARSARRLEPGRVRTSTVLIAAAGTVVTLCFAGHAAEQVAWSLHRGEALAALDQPWDMVLVGTGTVLLGLGTSWTKLGALVDRRREGAAATAQRVETIRPHWAQMVRAFPEVSPFVDDVRSHAATEQRLRFQQRRMVIEVYDAQRRLSSHLDAGHLALIEAKVRSSGLRGRTARAAAEHVGVRVALQRHGQGGGVLAVAAGVRSHTATTTEAAQHIAEGLRRINRHRARIETIVTAVLEEGTS